MLKDSISFIVTRYNIIKEIQLMDGARPASPLSPITDAFSQPKFFQVPKARICDRASVVSNPRQPTTKFFPFQKMLLQFVAEVLCMTTSWSSNTTRKPLAHAHSPLKWQVYVPQSNDAFRTHDLLNWPKGVDMRFPRSPPLAICFVLAVLFSDAILTY